MGSQQTDPDKILHPLLPLRDVVVYPHMVVPLFVGREKSIVALEDAMESDKQIVLVAQKNPAEDNPSVVDVYEVGTFATILQMLKLPDGTLKVLVEGTGRVGLVEPREGEAFLQTYVMDMASGELDAAEADALTRSTLSLFEQYVNLSKKIPSEVITTVSGIEDANRLADTIASHMTLSLEQKQDVLEIADLTERFEHLMSLMESEIDIFQIEQRIRGRVKKQMEKSQREYYLNEQMKAIQQELGDGEDGKNEMDELNEKISATKLSKEAREKVESEFKKLKNMSPMSAEATVVRNYLEWMTDLPWFKKDHVNIDLGKAIESIPKSLFSDRENELIDITRGKTGSLEFTSSGTSRNKTSFNLTYNFEGEYDSSGTYILDLINSMYVIAK